MPRVAIVGAGHNALVAAMTLAEAGIDVTVFEKNAYVGGACSTEYLDCGCYLNRGANCYTLLSEEVESVLKRVNQGVLPYEVNHANPSFVLATSEGEFEMPSVGDFVNEVASATGEDGAAISAFLDDLDAQANALRGIWSSPEPSTSRVLDLLRPSLDSGAPDFLNDSLTSVMRRYFVTNAAQTLFAATANIIPTAIDAPGTAFPLLYLSLGQASEMPGWGTAMGGMGTVTASLATAAEDFGANIKTECVVERLTKRSDGFGIRLSDGTEHHFDAVASSLSPWRTDELLEPREPPASHNLPIEYEGACARINVLLDSPLRSGGESSSELRTPRQYVICESLDSMASAYQDFRNAEIPEEPYLEIVSHYGVDSGASCGNHFPSSILAMYVPHERRRKIGHDSTYLLSRCVETVERHIPRFGSQILSADILMPEDMEAEWGMTLGNVDHGPLTPENRLDRRGYGVTPVGRTQTSGLYSCGAAVHPGGLVSGRSGLLAARTMLADFR